MNLKVITLSTGEIVPLDYAKQFLRIDYNDDDMLIQGMVWAAIEHAETFIRRSISTKTYELTLNNGENSVMLPNPPLVSVDSVLDDNDSAVEYELIEENGRSFINFNPNNKTVITYQAGYNKVPKTIEQAILILVSHFYENRETVIVGTSVVRMPFSVEALLNPHKSGWF